MTPSYTYDCPALDRLAQLAGATGDPDEGYPDGGADEPTEAVDVPAMVAQLAELPDAERLRIKLRIQGEYLATVSR